MGVAVSGIMPIRDGLKAHFPFVEVIVTALPLVDELLVGDGGSTDGTLEVLQRLAEVHPKIRILDTPHTPGLYWETLDRVIELLLSHAACPWVYEVLADEFVAIHDRALLRHDLTEADRGGFNGIRWGCIDITEWSRLAEYVYRNMRFIRNDPRVRSANGCDGFHYVGQPQVRPGFTTHNMPPEWDTQARLYHIPWTFPVAAVPKLRGATEFYGTQDAGRAKLLANHLPGYAALLANPVPWWGRTSIHPALPPIMHGLFDLGAYVVREEVFDPKWVVE